MSWHIRMDLEIRPSVWWRDQHPQLHSTKNCHFKDLNWRYLPGPFFWGLWGYAREYPQKYYGLKRHYLHFRGLKFVGFTACWTGLQQRKQRVGRVSSWGCLLLDGLTEGEAPNFADPDFLGPRADLPGFNNYHQWLLRTGVGGWSLK